MFFWVFKLARDRAGEFGCADDQMPITLIDFFPVNLVRRGKQRDMPSGAAFMAAGAGHKHQYYHNDMFKAEAVANRPAATLGSVITRQHHHDRQQKISWMMEKRAQRQHALRLVPDSASK